MKQLLAILCVGGLWLGAAPSGAQAAYTFTYGANAQWMPGSGWGTDLDEKDSPDLLGGSFLINGSMNGTTTSLTQGATWDVLIGSIQITEPAAHGGITSTETDNLGVTVKLTFSSPTGVVLPIVTLSALGTTGSPNDTATDVTLTFDSAIVPFGGTGSFTVSVGSISGMTFSNQVLLAKDPVSVYARVHFDTEPTGGGQGDIVPEPTSIALAGFAGIGMAIGAMRRRRQSKAAAA